MSDVAARLLQIVSIFILLVGYIPHIMQLLKKRDSSGHSLTGWIIWLVGGFVSLLIAIVLQDALYLLVYFITVIFLIITVTLVIKYRKPQE